VAAKDATTTIPIVMLGCDAVAAGFISSLARPGGNLTGVTCITSEIAAERLELLRQMLPYRAAF
jgi:putative ABC transport system substrate-binding protein